jgi:hypothetical protein
MKWRSVGSILGASALSVSCLSCTQASVDCTVGHAGSENGYAAKYTLTKDPLPACAAKPGFLKKGDILGLETYHPRASGGGEKGQKPDFEKTLVAISADSLGNLLAGRTADPTPGHTPYALGEFASVEPKGGFCAVHSMKPAEQHLPEHTTTEGETVPATRVRYDWRNVRVYVTPDAPGTQLSADLTYTENDCSADYHVVGVWPAVDCEATGADGKGTGKPDEAKCKPDDPEHGRMTGSGINPDFPVACDADLLLCVLQGEPPALKR